LEVMESNTNALRRKREGIKLERNGVREQILNLGSKRQRV
jgi:hypothetical protein